MENYFLKKIVTSIQYPYNSDEDFRASTYIKNLIETKQNVLFEIQENIIKLTPDNVESYLLLTKNRLYATNRLLFLSKKKLNEILSQYGFISIDDISMYIQNENLNGSVDLSLIVLNAINSSFKNTTDNLVSEEHKVRQMLLDFFISDIISEILDACNQELKNYLESQKIKKNTIDNSYKNNVFKNQEAQNWFEETMSEYRYLNEERQLKKRGFGAFAKAIFINDTCKANIFVPRLTETELITFLKKEYKAEIKSKDKLSDGKNHSIDIKKEISKYLQNKSE